MQTYIEDYSLAECDGRGVIKCFGQNMYTMIKDQGKTLLKDLNEGDLVLAYDAKDGKEIYSAVNKVLFKDFTNEYDFFSIKTESGDNLVITGNHYLIGNTKMVLPKNLNKGDTLLTPYREVVIRKIDQIREVGALSFSTEEGTIVVNNIVCSCFVERTGQELH